MRTLTKTINNTLILLGILTLGQILFQITFRTINLDNPEFSFFVSLQLVIFLPIGVITYFMLKKSIGEVLIAISIIFSLYLVNFTSLFVYSIPDPVKTFKDNPAAVLRTFADNSLILVPLLIGYLAAFFAIRIAGKKRSK